MRILSTKALENPFLAQTSKAIPFLFYFSSFLRQLTLITNPMQAIAVRRDEPPYDRNRRGIPVIGMSPMTMPTFTMKWNMNIPKMPEQT